jgi:hypothetical protein
MTEHHAWKRFNLQVLKRGSLRKREGSDLALCKLDVRAHLRGERSYDVFNLRIREAEGGGCPAIEALGVFAYGQIAARSDRIKYVLHSAPNFSHFFGLCNRRLPGFELSDHHYLQSVSGRRAARRQINGVIVEAASGPSFDGEADPAAEEHDHEP